ncbi:two-component sensor histidine kinase [Paenibacillus zeisoli]|uniref:histidine kinase n=1 Tax=Paenibacillus zeisoli TaxID=2496267 RepID=A0A3S1B6M8_9BACL|nr:histidine kinase [Paenibacillus zeisoli]RUT29841.1 two-component sensor histidine kinase [Paenibacillus zeisoli]
MSYRQIKWMILIVPSIIVGLWEFVRHQFLVSYISMGLGNFITPVILFVVSITLLYRLFAMLERVQNELNEERAQKAQLVAREQLARELHDGIAQSLFLLSVKIDKAERRQNQAGAGGELKLDELRKTVHEVNRYVRQSISNLKYPPAASNLGQMTLRHRIIQMMDELQVHVQMDWALKDADFTAKEQVELLACIREALLNAKKHAPASQITLQGEGDSQCWRVRVTDNGPGFGANIHTEVRDKYGLKIMRERAEEMGWTISIGSEKGMTMVLIEKGGTQH